MWRLAGTGGEIDMINLCDCCKALNAAPRRSDVPPHLKRSSIGDVVPRLPVSHFRCEACGTRWSWSVSRGWHAKWDDSVLLEGVRLRAPVLRAEPSVAVPVAGAPG
jgi:hypothetical protein